VLSTPSRSYPSMLRKPPYSVTAYILAFVDCPCRSAAIRLATAAERNSPDFSNIAIDFIRAYGACHLHVYLCTFGAERNALMSSVMPWCPVQRPDGLLTYAPLPCALTCWNIAWPAVLQAPTPSLVLTMVLSTLFNLGRWVLFRLYVPACGTCSASI
jgi:hypothetical protein